MITIGKNPTYLELSRLAQRFSEGYRVSDVIDSSYDLEISLEKGQHDFKEIIPDFVIQNKQTIILKKEVEVEIDDYPLIWNFIENYVPHVLKKLKEEDIKSIKFGTTKQFTKTTRRNNFDSFIEIKNILDSNLRDDIRGILTFASILTNFYDGCNLMIDGNFASPLIRYQHGTNAKNFYDFYYGFIDASHFVDFNSPCFSSAGGLQAFDFLGHRVLQCRNLGPYLKLDEFRFLDYFISHT